MFWSSIWNDVSKPIDRFIDAYEMKAQAERRSSIVEEATLVNKLYGISATVTVLNKIKTK